MKKISWGSIIVDSVTIICATLSQNWWLLLVILLTGGYTYEYLDYEIDEDEE